MHTVASSLSLFGGLTPVYVDRTLIHQSYIYQPGTGSDSRRLKTKAWYLVRSYVLTHNEQTVCVNSSHDEMAAGCVRLPCRSAVPRCIHDCESYSDLTWTYLNIWFLPQHKPRLHEVCWWPGPAPRNTAPWCTEPPRPQCCPAGPTWSGRDTNHQSCRLDQRDKTNRNSPHMLYFYASLTLLFIIIFTSPDSTM